MILMISSIVKALLPIILMAIGCFILRNRLDKRQLLGMCVLTVIFALIANWASNSVPSLRDEVTLTALGEKNAEAQAEEVYLQGYTIDGKEYICGKDLDIRDGKWFWTGETYCWRIESDTRQPEGVTRSVTIAIPVGWSRTLNFEGDVWRGIVEISAGDVTKKVDTYTAEGSTVVASIGRSKTNVLIWNQALHLAVYGLVFFVLVMALYTAAVWKRERFRQFNANHRGVLLFAAIALFQFVLAVKYSGLESFWYDELCELGWTERFPNLIERAFCDAVPRPISEFILGAWFLIAPFGDRVLLIFPELFTSLGIFFIGLCGKEYKSVRAGTFSELFASFSFTLLNQCSYEIRSYCMFFAFSAVLLYITIIRYKSKGKTERKIMIAFTVVMVIFSQTHYHAYVFLAAIFIFEVFVNWRYKLNKFSVVPYCILGICTIPCAVSVLKSHFVEAIEDYNFASWQPVPTHYNVTDLLNYLGSYYGIVQVLFWTGLAFALVSFLFERHESPRVDLCESLTGVIPIYLLAFVVLFFYIYGNLKTNATFWYNRYFTDLLPCFYMICGFGADKVCDLIDNSLGYKKTFITTAIVVSAVMLPTVEANFGNVDLRTSYEPYRQAADWIYTQSNYIYNDSIVILTDLAGSSRLGWTSYYVERYGKRDPINIVGGKNIDILQYDRVYTVLLHGTIDPDIMDILSENYYIDSEFNDVGITVYNRK